MLGSSLWPSKFTISKAEHHRSGQKCEGNQKGSFEQQRRSELQTLGNESQTGWIFNLGSIRYLIKKLLLFYVDFILVVLDRIQCDHSKTVATTVMTIRIPKHDHATVA